MEERSTHRRQFVGDLQSVARDVAYDRPLAATLSLGGEFQVKKINAKIGERIWGQKMRSTVGAKKWGQQMRPKVDVKSCGHLLDLG